MKLRININGCRQLLQKPLGVEIKKKEKKESEKRKDTRGVNLELSLLVSFKNELTNQKQMSQ